MSSQGIRISLLLAASLVFRQYGRLLPEYCIETQGVPLEDVQYLARHSNPRTTRLYDRRQKKVTRNIVERISI
jgi:hypothetical protein